MRLMHLRTILQQRGKLRSIVGWDGVLVVMSRVVKEVSDVNVFVKIFENDTF